MAESNLITIDFHGKQLETFKEGDTEWVSVRSLCEGMGLHTEAQQKKLNANKEKFNTSLKRGVGKDGKSREIYCIPLKKMPGWLFTVDPNRVKPEARETVELYQEECFDVLYSYWHGKGQQSKPQQPQLPVIQPETITTVITIEPGKPPRSQTYAGKVALVPCEALIEFEKVALRLHRDHMFALEKATQDFLEAGVTAKSTPENTTHLMEA